MIFYFTGTGNSLYVAKNIEETQGDKLISIVKELHKKKDAYIYELEENEPLGFVFPVYAWAPPKMVLEFIKKMEIKGNPYVFSVSTCGDEEGETTAVLRKALLKKNLTLDSAFSVRMPNNYIIGFDVDDKETENKKLEDARKRMIDINKIISEKKKNNQFLIPGKMAKIKTAIANPLFQKFALSTKGFYAEDNCTRCKLCEAVCPAKSIRVEDKPVWGEECTQCLACINRCPTRAIQRGQSTKIKGRYQHPELTVMETQINKRF